MTTAAHPLKVACSNCNLRELCMPGGLSPEDLARLDGVVAARRKVKRRAPLFRRGDAFECLYAVRSGFFKTTVLAQDGRELVTGFQMAGEVIGLDGIVSDRHMCDAVALEDSEVCAIPFEQLETLSREIKSLQHQLHRIMSREIVRDQGVMQLLAGMRAEQRVAAFLLNVIQRLHARGFSRTELLLRMTREEIGNYLGLQLETVSRTLSRFADEGLIAVRHRHLRILNEAALQMMVDRVD